MRVLVTGAAGFLGGALVRRCHGLGWAVRGTSHAADGLARLGGLLERGFLRGLADPVDPAMFADCDAVVHCAYDARPGTERDNVAGTRALCDAALGAGVPYQLFVSSHSARPDAVSAYGRLKWRQEQDFLQLGLGVVRPGLVIGPGGLYARTRRSIERSRVLVLPGADVAPVFYIALDDLLAAMELLLTERIYGAHTLFAEPPCTLREFALAVARSAGLHPPVVSVPLAPLFVLSALLRRVPGLAGAGLERLESLRLNLRAPLHASELGAYVPQSLGLQEAVERAGGDG